MCLLIGICKWNEAFRKSILLCSPHNVWFGYNELSLCKSLYIWRCVKKQWFQIHFYKWHPFRTLLNLIVSDIKYQLNIAYYKKKYIFATRIWSYFQLYLLSSRLPFFLYHCQITLKEQITPSSGVTEYKISFFHDDHFT